MASGRNPKNRVCEGAEDLARRAWGGHPPGLDGRDRAQGAPTDGQRRATRQPV